MIGPGRELRRLGLRFGHPLYSPSLRLIHISILKPSCLPLCIHDTQIKDTELCNFTKETFRSWSLK